MKILYCFRLMPLERLRVWHSTKPPCPAQTFSWTQHIFPTTKAQTSKGASDRIGHSFVAGGQPDWPKNALVSCQDHGVSSQAPSEQAGFDRHTPGVYTVWARQHGTLRTVRHRSRGPLPANTSRLHGKSVLCSLLLQWNNDELDHTSAQLCLRQEWGSQTAARRQVHSHIRHPA